MQPPKIFLFHGNVFFVVLLLLSCSSTPPSGNLQDDCYSHAELDAAIREASGYINGRVTKGSTIAIVSISSNFPELSKYIIDSLTENLVNGDLFTVVDRQHPEDIRSEENYQISGEVDDITAQSLGKKLGAQVIIRGSLSPLRNKYRLTVKGLAVESAQVLFTFNRNLNVNSGMYGRLSYARRVAAVSFAGDVPEGRDRHTIIAGLRNAMQTWKTDLYLDENASAGVGYGFIVTVYRSQFSSGLFSFRVTAGFTRDGLVLDQAEPYDITEIEPALPARKIAGRLAEDGDFFNRVNKRIQ